MSIVKKIKQKFQKTGSPAFKRDMAEKISVQRLRYVTERRDGIETVIGKSGGFSIKNDFLIVLADLDIAFRGYIPELEISELLSKEGAVIVGRDLEHGNEMRTIVAYYVYYI